MKVPMHSIDLIEELDKAYPDKMIVDNNMSEFERAKLAGKVELIRTLKLGIKQESKMKDV